MKETVVVERMGTAETKRAAIDLVLAPWSGGDVSMPKILAAGAYYMQYFAMKTPGSSWAFRVRVIEPRSRRRVLLEVGGTLPASGKVSGQKRFVIP